MTKKELIGCIGGMIGLISICFGVYFWFETRYAHAGDMTKAMEVIKKMGDKLDYKISDDQLKGVQQRIWAIEDRYCPDKTKPCDEGKMPEIVRNQYRELKLEREKLQNELKVLQNKK